MYFPKSSKDKDPLKPEWGAWYIVINSCNTSTEKYYHPLKSLWRFITTHASEFFWSPRGAEILEVKNMGESIEKGGKYHRVHLNGYIAIKTTGLAYLNIHKIIRFVNENLDQVDGFKACNIHYEKIKNFNSNKAIEDYIEKDPISVDDRDDFEIIPP
jgi:hypothetical protein